MPSSYPGMPVVSRGRVAHGVVPRGFADREPRRAAPGPTGASRKGRSSNPGPFRGSDNGAEGTTVETTPRTPSAVGCTRATALQRIESTVATTPIRVSGTPGDGSGTPSPLAPTPRGH